MKTIVPYRFDVPAFDALCTAGTQRRDYLHVSDVAAALARLVISAVTGIVNVASGVAPTIASIATQIANRLKKTAGGSGIARIKRV